jgi:hypothetical protein
MHAVTLKNRMFYHLKSFKNKRGTGFLVMFVLCIFPLLVSSAIQAQTSTPVIAGYRDFNFGTVVDDELTGEKPESKLWWNDGYWWACMWNNSEGRYKIYRYNPGNPPGWTNTGTSIDDRSESRADILWDGQKLYVVSHIFSGSSSGVPSQDPLDWARCYRFSYSNGTYNIDSGFPTYVNISTSETLVLAKDSTGKLWVTWIENSKVKLATSSDDGVNWGSAFDLPNQGGRVNSDDISAVVAFGGNKTGVMWSNQQDDKIYFMVHNDGDSELTWQAREDAVSDPVLIPISDDHLNLKPAADGSGNLYATTKTGLTGAGKPLVFFLKRSPSGTWTPYQLWGTEDETTRPIIVIDSTHQKLYAFARSLAPGPGIIYKKEVDLTTMSIPSGLGEVFIQSDTDLDINNPTSTKQWVTSETSLLVLCSDKITNYYMHNYIDLRDVTVPIISSITPNIGPVGSAVTIRGNSFTDATEVAFNGVSDMTFNVVSDSIIHATVPNSATTGFISITNMVGTGTSLDSFVVTAPPYLLTFFTIGSGTVTLNPPGGTYDSVTTVTLTAVPDSGYVFEEWSGGLTGSANPESIVMNENKTVTAIFVPEGGIGGGIITYRETVLGGLSGLTAAATFDTLTAVTGDLYLAAIASRLLVPVTSVTGLGLTWTLVETQCGARSQDKLEIWKAQGTPTGGDYVMATFSDQPRNAVIAVTRYSGVDPVSPIAATISGNTLGLNGACSGGTDSDTYYFPVTTPVDNAVVYGVATMRNKRHYPGNGYKERAEYSEGSLGEDASIAVQDRAFPSAVTDSLHGRFSSTVDWGVIGLVLKPQGAINAKNLAISKTGSGSGNVALSPAGGIYEYLTEVELTAVPDSGSVFSGWSGDLTGTQNPDMLLMDDDKMVTAEFARMYTLTVDTIGSGGVTLNPAGGQYDPGTQVVLTAVPDSAFAFRGWGGDLDSLVNPDTLMMDSDKYVSATFIRQFTLAVDTVGPGGVALDPPGGVYDSLTSVVLTATPDFGYSFKGWSGDLTANASPDTLIMDSTKTVTATFVKQFVLNIDTIGFGGVALDPPGGVYDSATVVELSAAPDSGYVFGGWSGDLVSSSNPDSIVMDTDKHIIATFIEFAPVVVNTKIFLEGPYDVDTMKTDLRDSSLVPLSQPFNKAPWNYTGLEVLNSLPPGVVDWVLIGLRISADAADMTARAAFVKNDGSVVDTNGTSPVSFDTVNAGNYYLVVYHRNHLPIMSNAALALDNVSPLYDFTTAQTRAYSGGGTPMKELTTSVYGLIAGDGNHDGLVNDADQDSVWRWQNATTWEYTKLADFNLDGGIDVTDMNLHWRPNFNSTTQVPGIIVTTAGRITTTTKEVSTPTASPARKQKEIRTKDQPAKSQRKNEHRSQQNSRQEQQEGNFRTSE